MANIAHSALDQRTRFTNAKGHDISFGSDALGRVTGVTNAIGKAVTFGYHPTGELA